MKYLIYKGEGPVIYIHFGHINGNPVGKFIQQVDGYYYFLHDTGNGGIIPGYIIRELTDKLDELNRPMDEKIEKYFNQNKEQ